MQFEISKVSADFEETLNQLVAYKNQVSMTNPQVWKDFMTSSTGQTILELIAGSVTFNQFYIESAFREAFPSTALRDSSIYAIARLLGVNIERKRPAALGIKLLNTTTNSIIIGKNSEFNVDGIKFFNREEIILNPSTNFVVGKQIFEGYIKQKSLGEIVVPSDVYLNEPGFVVSSFPGDLSLLVKDSNGLESGWTPAESSLYSYGPSSKVYYINTTGNGDVVFTFGDGNNGAIPGPNSDTTVQYVVTAGSIANKAINSIVGGAINKRISVYYYADPDSVKVEIDDTSSTQLGVYGGTDEKPATYYKTYAPYLYRAKQRAVTKADYIAIIMSLGGIASVIVEAQRDLNPYRVDFMNVVQVCALPSSPLVDLFTTAEKVALVEDLNRYAHACIKVNFVDPNVILIKLKYTIYIKPTYNIDTVKNKVKTNIVTFFDKSASSLGRKIYLSDLISVAIESGGVDHCRVEEQTGTGNAVFQDKISVNNKTYYKLDVSTLDVTAVYTDRSIQSVDSYI